jgi:hypothetical protein
MYKKLEYRGEVDKRIHNFMRLVHLWFFGLLCQERINLSVLYIQTKFY